MEQLIGGPSTSEKKGASHAVSETCTNVQFRFVNPPVKVWSARDYKTKCTKVFVALTLFAGVKGIEFKFNEEGTEIAFSFAWPSAFYRPSELFEGLTSKPGEMSIDLKTYTFAGELLQDGITDLSSPRGEIIVKLPIPVQKDDGSWTKTKIKKDDGTRVYLAEFKGFQDKLIVEQSDTSLNFD